MKKVINGRTYNTETAKLIKTKTNYEIGYNDLDYWYEELYQKKNGEYFIYGYGNARTVYAKYLGNGSTAPGGKIFPISKEIADDYMKEDDLTISEIINRATYSHYDYDFNFEM